ncbi:hypothetical protein ELQ92_09160 [Labedella populi]|uniref:Uncharacterized protein n=1 Tax=Labedella populi TaxID=2498850 RepID=A0A3S4DX06_9MICO|nr:hypothetical protein [Labedella populi]RWZ61186.1 hypothetical protein ELQ92_09160 [Labedella populi]
MQITSESRISAGTRRGDDPVATDGPSDGGWSSGAARAFGGRVRVDARGERLWRVSTDSFAVIGHVELLDTAGGEVYLAKRYSPVHTRFVDRGRFWSMEDALECLWYSS